MIWFVARNRSRQWISHLVSPILGFAIVAYVLVNAQTNAKVAGLIWLGVGALVLIVIKLRGGRPGALTDEEMLDGVPALDELGAKAPSRTADSN